MKPLGAVCSCGSHHTAQDPVMPDTVRKDQELMVCMEIHNVPDLSPGPGKVFPSLEYEYPFYEILPEQRILKTAVILYRHKRKAHDECPGKDTNARMCRNSGGIVY